MNLFGTSAFPEHPMGVTTLSRKPAIPSSLSTKLPFFNSIFLIVLIIGDNHLMRVTEKQVQQLYVGTTDKIYQILTREGEEFRVRSYDFGRVVALLHASEELGLVDAINRAIPKKDVKGLSIGEYILLLIIARGEQCA
jgi:hypothetical protein